MPPHPIESLRHEQPSTLALRPDLADLEARAERALEAASEQRERLAQELQRIRQDWAEWIISGAGAVLAVAGLIRMILFGVDLFDLIVSGGGSILTLWGASRFRRKILAEWDLRRQFDWLTEKAENLGEARRKIQQARRLGAGP